MTEPDRLLAVKRLLAVLAAIVLGMMPVAFASISAAASSTAASSTTSAARPEAIRQVAADVNDFTFESFTADYYLARDAQGHATLTTVETFVANFPTFDQNRGMIRAIPNDYDGVPQNTRVVSVVDENGDPVPYTVEIYNRFTEVALGTDDYVHGKTTYTITYTNENVVRAFADSGKDEFYTDTNGVGFYQPFGVVTARVHIDSALTEYLTGSAACYRGVQGSTAQCEVTEGDADGETGRSYSATAHNLGPQENVSLSIEFEGGTFVQVPPESGYDTPWAPSGPRPPWIDIGGIAIGVFALLASAFTIVWRFMKPKESKGRGIIIPQYTVPQGINLLESAEIVGQAWKGVAAQIVSFAVRGKLRILDYPVTKSGAKYTLQLLDTSDIDDQERALLAALFGGDLGESTLQTLRSLNIFGATTLQQIEEQSGSLALGAVREVGVVDDRAARAVASVQAATRPRVLSRGLKKKRSSVAGFLLAASMFLLFFVAVGLTIVGSFYGEFSGATFAAAFVSMLGALVAVGFAWRPPAVTESGAEWRDYLVGMRDYVKLAEAERFAMLQSPEGALRMRVEGIDPRYPAQKVKLYEKLLPFAVMWGVEKEWAKELTIYYGDAAPEWFISADAFNVNSFSNAMANISSTAVVNTAPSVSSGRSSWAGSSGGSFSSGSHGGGFSGGGRGGGGGGGR